MPTMLPVAMPEDTADVADGEAELMVVGVSEDKGKLLKEVGVVSTAGLEVGAATIYRAELGSKYERSVRMTHSRGGLHDDRGARRGRGRGNDDARGRRVAGRDYRRSDNGSRRTRHHDSRSGNGLDGGWRDGGRLGWSNDRPRRRR